MNIAGRAAADTPRIRRSPADIPSLPLTSEMNASFPKDDPENIPAREAQRL